MIVWYYHDTVFRRRRRGCGAHAGATRNPHIMGDINAIADKRQCSSAASNPRLYRLLKLWCAFCAANLPSQIWRCLRNLSTLHLFSAAFSLPLQKHLHGWNGSDDCRFRIDLTLIWLLSQFYWGLSTPRTWHIIEIHFHYVGVIETAWLRVFL